MRTVKICEVFFGEFHPSGLFYWCPICLLFNFQCLSAQNLLGIPIDLSLLEDLEAVELGLVSRCGLPSMYEEVLQTITSNQIQKITFYTHGSFIRAVLNSELTSPAGPGWMKCFW